MKTKFLLVTLTSVLFFSCKKETIETETANKQNLPGLESVDLANMRKLEGEVVFQMNYDSTLTQEEAKALWDKDVNNYMQSQFYKNSKNNLIYSIETFTSHRAGGTTTGQIVGGVITLLYNSHNGASVTATLVQEISSPSNPSNTAGWNYKLVQAISNDFAYYNMANIIQTSVSLKGTDEWYPLAYNVYIRGSQQFFPASGGTNYISQPNRWFDNATSTGIDLYENSVRLNSWLTY